MTGITLDPEIAGEIATAKIGALVLEDEGVRYTLLASQVASEHRWYTRRLIAYQHATAHEVLTLGFYYLDPASELQEDQDRFEDEPVPCFEVQGEPVTTTVYSRVAADV